MSNADICPTITASNSQDYYDQIERIVQFTRRLHIDLSDGVFAPIKLLGINDIWWPGGMTADLHIMYQKPLEVLDSVIALKPQLIIVHAESDGKYVDLVKIVKSHGIEVGLAILPETEVSAIASVLDETDHLMIFSGNLGHQGGSSANLELLSKVAEIRALKPTIEIGWDGGINLDNAMQLVDGGVDVLNVGSFIQAADNPSTAYWSLKNQVMGIRQ
jgi:ribulose-phosphate 3-epimerase